MRVLCFLALIFAAGLPGFSQTAVSAAPGLPKDPREIFAMAAPFYDFTSPDLKPWHLKATYQLYDQNGKPTEQGTYEYWWASPKVYRSTWTRPGVTRTDWYTADGTHVYQATGERLKYFERRLQSALFSPLPSKAALNSEDMRLDLQEKKSKGVKFPCISQVPMKLSQMLYQPFGSTATYCFDSQQPILRTSFTSGVVATVFNSVAKYQDRFLAREILISGGERKLFSARVDTVDGLDSSDPALTPAPDAAKVKAERMQVGEGVIAGMLVKKQPPVYPILAKQLRQQGTVVIEATIGIDGKIHDPEMVFTPSESLAASALEAVSHWEYKPYMLNGEPVEVETTIKVIFTLGR
jgi:TonB family protein